MGATIRKSYTIFTIGSITITGFILSKVGTRVVISNSISISVDSWPIFNRGRMSNRVGNRDMVDRGSVNNRCRHVDGCWGVVDRGRGMVGRGGGVIRFGSMVHYGSMVGLGCVRKGGRSVDPNNGLLVA